MLDNQLLTVSASPGIAMAAEALTGALDAAQIRTLAPAFVADLIRAYRG